MAHLIRHYLTFGMAILGAGAIVAVSSPVAFAEDGRRGGLGGAGNSTVTGPGGTTIGTADGGVTGLEMIPGGTPGAPTCTTGGRTGSLTGSTGIATGQQSTTPSPATGLQITQTVVPPPRVPPPGSSRNATATVAFFSGAGSVQTPIVGVSGGLNGYICG